MKQSNFLVILDSLSDVGNIGAIARSAYALGAEGIIASGVRQLNFAGIARSSSGALFDIPFLIEQNPLSCINELQQLGFKLYGAAMDGVAVSDIEFSQKKVLVLGSEGEGISKRVKPKIDQMVSIPMQREFDSLNVSAAAAILLHRMNG
jgi:23S rRNA (guanosine2251-2'-O)-methyltransferase